jgi:hypothetical protein
MVISGVLVDGEGMPLPEVTVTVEDPRAPFASDLFVLPTSASGGRENDAE